MYINKLENSFTKIYLIARKIARVGEECDEN